MGNFYNIIGINLMIYFYYDVIRYKSGLKILFFNDYEDNIIKIANMNNFDVLCDKIKVLNDTLSNIKYNLNINSIKVTTCTAAKFAGVQVLKILP